MNGVFRPQPKKSTILATTFVLSNMVSTLAPVCLSGAATDVMVNDVPLKALIDKESYIAEFVVLRHRLKVEKSSTAIYMPSTSLIAHTNATVMLASDPRATCTTILDSRYFHICIVRYY